MPYLKGDCPSLLEANVPKITRAYITSRFDSGLSAPGALLFCKSQDHAFRIFFFQPVVSFAPPTITQSTNS
jgi:hypothetical protein